jgi:hypothetical protein
VIRNFHNIYSYPYGLAVLGHNFDDHWQSKFILLQYIEWW